jgi:hypothetical protein
MNKMNPKRVAVFFFVFATIAVVIYVAQGTREQQQVAAVTQQQREQAAVTAQQQQAAEKEAAAKKSAQDAAAERAKFLARYLYPDLSRRLGMKTVAIAVASEDGKMNRAVSAALVSRFKTEPVQIFPSYFKPEFVSDGLFNEAFGGSSELLNKLELAKSLDGIVLAQQNVQYTQNSALENVISATMQLKVAVVPVSGQSDGKTWTFTAYGPGFTKEVARQAAEERLIKQITTDTNMSLSPINRSQ